MSENVTVEELPETSKSHLSFDRRILYVAYRKKIKFIILAMFIAMVLAGIWVKIRISPSWKANCYVIRSPKNMSTPVEMPYLYQTFDINTILETVRTRDVLKDVIKRLNLKISPEGLYKAIDVQRGNRSNVMKFSATWEDREMAAKVANTTAESFILHNTMLLNSATLKIYNYYQQQQQIRVNNIQNLELQYEQFRAQYGVISIPQETQSKFDQLKEIELKMVENNLRFSEMDTKVKEMDDKLKQLPEEVIRTWTYTQTDEKKMLQLEKDLDILRSKYTDDNPKIMKVKREIEELRKTMQATKRDLPEAVTWGPSGLNETYTVDKTRFEADRQASTKLKEEFQLKVQELKAALENLTHIQKEFMELERQLSLNRDILRIVEGRLAESKMAMQSNVSDYDILEEATAPSYPEGTKRKLIVLAIGMFIFVFGSGFVVLTEIIDPFMKSDKAFSDVIKIPVIGVLPDEEHVDKNVFYRNIQVLVDNVIRLGKDKPRATICFGSDIPETGKSFLIQEVIRMLFSHSKKILFIDSISKVSEETEPYIINDFIYTGKGSYKLDTRNPSLHYAYFLADDSVFTAVVDQSRVQSFLDSLADYDYVFWELFNSQYCIQLFASIAAASDALVMVSRFQRSSRNNLAHAVQFLKDRDFSSVYGVLNYVQKDYFWEKY